MNSLNYANRLTPITDEDINVIMGVRKALLFESNKPFAKNDSDQSCNVAMGSFDGTEICTSSRPT